MNSESSKPKKKSLLKKILIGFGSLLVVLILAAISIPYFFKDDIKTYINKEINENVEAKVEFGDINISLFKSFPNLNTNISNIVVNGVNEFKNDSLFFAKEVNLEMDLFSLFSKKIEIIDFSIVEPIINIIVLPDGKANYNITKKKKQESSTSSTKLKDLKLQHYSIIDANLTYSDLQNKQGLKISNLNHSGSGDFQDVQFNLKTSTKIDEINFKSDGISLLKNAKLNWDINFDVNLNKMLFDIKENTLNLNELKLISVGQLTMLEEFIEINLHLKAPGNSFKEIYSIIPNAYTKDFNSIKTSGNFTFKGAVNGKYYFNQELYPDFKFNIKTIDGYIKSPDMPLPIEKINSNISIVKKGNSLDNTVVDINPMTFTVQDEIMKMNINIQNPMTNLLTSGNLNGKLNLGVISKAFPIEDIKVMSGKLNTNLSFKFNKSLSTKMLKGFSNAKDIKIKYSDMPLVSVKNADTKFSNQEISVNNLTMNLGNSDINGNVKISNPLNYFTKNKSITINVNGKSNLFDANEWLTKPNKTEVISEKSSSTDQEMIDLIKNRIVLNFDYNIQRLKYEDYDLKNFNIIGNYSLNTLNINKQSLIVSGSNLSIDGKLNNIISWVLEDKEMKGVVSINSPHFDLDKFMGEETSKGKNTNNVGEEETFEIPDNMNISVNTDIKRINYTGKDLRNINGTMLIKNRKVSLKNMEAQGMGGTMHINGTYSTPLKKPAEFDINYKMSNMRYEEMYKSIIAYKTLAPVSKFITGIFNANFSFSGKMKDGFTPDLTSINASGLIHTLNAYIKNYPALNNLASKLQVKSLNNIKIEDSKNRFEIVNGTVKVNPFDVKFDDMNFNISGINNLDKTIDYTVHAKIPKSKIGNIPGSKTIDKGLGFLSSKAKSAGLNFEIGNIINLDLSIKGLYNKPNIKIKFVGTSQGRLGNKVKEDTTNIVNKAKEDTKKEIDKKKKEAEEKAKKAIADTKKKVTNKVDETKKKVKKEINKKVEETSKKAKNKLKDALKDLWK